MLPGHELEAIRQTVLDYMEGMIRADLARLRNSFHPSALIVGHMAGVFTTETMDQFVRAVEEAGGLSADVPLPATIVVIDVAGPSAVAKVENDFANMRYTDYLSLLKIDGKWVIVHKTYHEWGKA